MSEPELFTQMFNNRFKMDISSLIPWSNWLTPLDFHETPRFNTAFFLLPLNTQKPQKVVHCAKEMNAGEWVEPAQVIEKNEKREISLPPPQFYELSRIQPIKCLPDKNAIEKMTDPRRMTPQVFRANGSAWKVYALPGDYLYEENNADFKPPTLGEENELYPPYPENETKPIHRIVFHSDQNQLQHYYTLKIFVKNL